MFFAVLYYYRKIYLKGAQIVTKKLFYFTVLLKLFFNLI